MKARSRWNQRKAIACAVVALCSLLLASLAAANSIPSDWNRDWCTEDNHGDGPSTCVVSKIKVDRVPDVLRVDQGENGGVEVAAGDGPGIEVSARVTAWGGTESERSALISSIQITNDASGLHATEKGTSTKDNSKLSWSAHFRIVVPARTALELRAMNGPLAIYGMKGRSVLRAENGPVAIVRAGGDVTAEVANGPLEVTLDGTRWDGRGLKATAANGPVDLLIPRDYNADFTTGTINGPWIGPHEMVVADHQSYKHDKLGSGGAPISVTTVNGPFTIRRTGRESD